MTKTKKKLPKAVSRTADDMRRAGAADAIEMAAVEREEPPVHLAPSEAPEAPEPATTRLDPAWQPEVRNGHVLAPIPGEAPERRRSRAIAIVERYSNLSALGGVVPLPLLNVAGVSALIVRMVRLLCEHYNVPYEIGRARALVVGIAGGSVPTTASAVTTSTLVFFVPGVNMLGLAVSSVTASVCARAIGQRVVEHFESGGNLMDFPVVDRKRKNGLRARD